MYTPMLALALLGASSAGLPAMWTCVVPPTVAVLQNDTCYNSLRNWPASHVDLAGMQGERESAQIVVQTCKACAPVSLLGVELNLPGANATVRQLGFVNTTATTRYAGSASGWFPDPVLPLRHESSPGGAAQLRPGEATPLWLSIDLPRLDSVASSGRPFSPGTLNGTISLKLRAADGLGTAGTFTHRTAGTFHSARRARTLAARPPRRP